MRDLQQQAFSPSWGSVEEWLVDDGQAFVRAELADTWLSAVDQAIADLGGHRTTGAECKSHARLLCTHEYATAHRNWASEYIQNACIVGSMATPPKALGVRIGSDDLCTTDMDTICSKVQAARGSIQELNSPAVELTLQRCCRNSGKAAYLLRCSGHRIAQDRLLRFDVGMASGLESALWGPLPD